MGKGFYDYKGRSEADLCRERDTKLVRMLKVYKEMMERIKKSMPQLGSHSISTIA